MVVSRRPGLSETSCVIFSLSDMVKCTDRGLRMDLGNNQRPIVWHETVFLKCSWGEESGPRRSHFKDSAVKISVCRLRIWFSNERLESGFN